MLWWTKRPTGLFFLKSTLWWVFNRQMLFPDDLFKSQNFNPSLGKQWKFYVTNDRVNTFRWFKMQNTDMISSSFSERWLSFYQSSYHIGRDILLWWQAMFKKYSWFINKDNLYKIQQKSEKNPIFLSIFTVKMVVKPKFISKTFCKYM